MESPVDAFMSKPEGDHRHIDPCLQQLHRSCVAQRVRGDVLGGDGRALLGGCGRMFGGEPLDRIGTEGTTASAGKQRLVRLPGTFG